MATRSRHDVGPVPCSIRLDSKPATRAPDEVDVGVGLLADVAAAYAKGWTGRWRIGLGKDQLELRTPDDLIHLEEFWVLLLEVVDADAGEWSLYDGDAELVMEAQVHGPDINLELSSAGGPPKFRGRRMPDRATVRLRAFVANGVAFFQALIDQAAKLDPSLLERDDLAGFREDLGQLTEAVADMPGTFKK
ncbi:MAG: hypothetical protein GY898_01830 [Proteobacteria bacterium]|nr:hypothetical protein [Pseudomonadota bacterium]